MSEQDTTTPPAPVFSEHKGFPLAKFDDAFFDYLLKEPGNFLYVYWGEDTAHPVAFDGMTQHLIAKAYGKLNEANRTKTREYCTRSFGHMNLIVNILWGVVK